MAEKRKITKKIVSAKPIKPREEIKEDVKVADVKTPSRRGCSFCLSKTSPSYTDVVTLKRYVSDRGKIVPSLRSGLCSKHQRVVTRSIKYARHLSLLPFVPKV